MAIVVRKADVKKDHTVLIKALQTHLNPQADACRYEWLYCANPFGEAQVWLALDDSGEAVGAAAAFPRPVLVRGRQGRGCVLGDFCISERHRSLGPALQLQKECLAGTRAGDYAFCYDFPSQRMAAIYGRLGLRPCGSLVRLAKVLGIDSDVLAGPSLRRFAKSLARTGDLVLGWLDKSPSSRFLFSEHRQRFGEEFTALSGDLAEHYAICTFRSATYLNWRYKDHPSLHYRVMTARTQQGKLAGYLISYRSGNAATIVDLAGGRDEKLLQGLVLAAAARLRSEGAKRLDFPVVGDSPWIALMRPCGFFPRETSPIMAWDGQSQPIAASRQVLLLAGDRES